MSVNEALIFGAAQNGGGGAAEWGQIGGDITDQTDLNQLFQQKQAALVSGTNIKTVNDQSILGSGNLEVSGLPAYTSADNGKFLTVANGAAAWTPVPQFQGGSY